jgi:hypothetical protein
MNGYMSFGEYAEQRDAARHRDTQTMPLDARGIDQGAGSHIRDHQLEAAGNAGQVEARSLFGNLFKSIFKPVNPARPVLPTNSRLLASPFNKKRLKSQVVGR